MIFCTNIPDTTGHQMAIQVPTSPSIFVYQLTKTNNNF